MKNFSKISVFVFLTWTLFNSQACRQIERDLNGKKLEANKSDTKSIAKIENGKVKIQVPLEEIAAYCSQYVSRQFKGFNAEKVTIKQGTNQLYFIEAVSKVNDEFVTVAIPLINENNRLMYQLLAGNETRTNDDFRCIHTCTSATCACSISNIEPCKGHQCTCTSGSGGCSANVLIE